MSQIDFDFFCRDAPEKFWTEWTYFFDDETEQEFYDQNLDLKLLQTYQRSFKLREIEQDRHLRGIVDRLLRLIHTFRVGGHTGSSTVPLFIHLSSSDTPSAEFCHL